MFGLLMWKSDYSGDMQGIFSVTGKDTLKQELEVQRIQVLRTTVLQKQVFTHRRFQHLPLGKVQFPTNVQGQ